jgi:putative transposase
MDDQKEEALRNEAINHRLAGEQRCDICRALGRSTAWFDKWWARYRREGRAGLKSRSRAPKHVHNRMRSEIEEAIVRIRKVLEERSDPELKYAFIGAATIRTELKRTSLRPLPSVRAVERALQRRELTQPRRKRKHPNEPTAYCPLPVAQNPDDVHALDIVIRHLLGGERVCSFHLLDLASRYPILRQYPDKSAVSAKSLLVAAWQTVGLPKLLQIDNEATFCGGYRHKRVFSQVVRLCLTVGVEVMFIPFYSPQKNADIESFNSDWDLAFWQRERFRDLTHVQEECQIFERWYRTRHEPPALEGLTPAEARTDFIPCLLSANFDLHQVERRLPLISGRVHFIRLVNSLGQINLLNESWTVEEEAEELVGEYVWATISTAEQRLRIYHQKAADAVRRLVVEYDYEIAEEVQELAPAYQPDGKVDALSDC